MIRSGDGTAAAHLALRVQPWRFRQGRKVSIGGIAVLEFIRGSANQCELKITRNGCVEIFELDDPAGEAAATVPMSQAG